MNRRDFLKYSIGGVATLYLGSRIGRFMGKVAHASGDIVDITITDALKDMQTHNAINTAQCYYWIYKMSVNGLDIPAESPGPYIVTTAGDFITLRITNALDEPHAFFISGMFDSGSIAPGQTVTKSFVASKAGAWLYYDNLNHPVNRVMGLHGAICVLPKNPKPGHRFTPYDDPTPAVQKLFDDFGFTDHFPGLAWEESDPATNTPPFRMYAWVVHQASPKLFAEVGSLPAGQDYPAADFMDAFLRDPFLPHTFHPDDNPGGNRIPQYFTINGQSGMFSHFSAYCTPIGRIGEPVVVRILNAGLWTHSMHLHANHMYITSVNGMVQNNPIWVDVFTIHPMDSVDYTVPFMRPPDIGTVRGIGMPETPLIALSGNPVYPPVEEFDVYLPGTGVDIANDIDGNPIDLRQRQSPLCYPMHDHSEPSQTSQGGNYNTGLISGIYFVGDRNTPGWMDFPMDEDFLMYYNGVRGIHEGIEQPSPDPLG